MASSLVSLASIQALREHSMISDSALLVHLQQRLYADCISWLVRQASGQSRFWDWQTERLFHGKVRNLAFHSFRLPVAPLFSTPSCDSAAASATALCNALLTADSHAGVSFHCRGYYLCAGGQHVHCQSKPLITGELSWFLSGKCLTLGANVQNKAGW